MKVRLEEVIESLEAMPDEMALWLDLDTGKTLFEADPDIVGEDGVDMDGLRKLRSSPDRFLRLPAGRDLHEWGLMHDFAARECPPTIGDQLLDAIHGKGAFRRFKTMAERLGVLEQWYRYKNQAIRDFAIAWCEEQGLAWT